MTSAHSLINATPIEKQNLYNKFEINEETQRLAYHYDVDSEFFIKVTGGAWNTYSCSIFKSGDTMTQAQERKLDIFAQLMGLSPGKRILDIGCGWGGPLTYLCHKYGVTGVGLTVTPAQIPYASTRAASYKVSADFIESHWENFHDEKGFDAIFTDEVVVHVHNFNDFFKKCHSLLRPKGVVVNKELHLTQERFKDWSDGLGVHVNKVYGFTGNYRLLEEEIDFGLSNGFYLKNIVPVAMKHYQETVGNHWIKNLKWHESELKRLTSEEHFNDFYKYLRCTMVSFRHDVFRQHMLVFQKNGES